MTSGREDGDSDGGAREVKGEEGIMVAMLRQCANGGGRAEEVACALPRDAFAFH